MRQKQGNPATAPTRHSHGASRHRIRNQRHHAQQPHPPQGACSLAARNALITAQPQVKGNHHEHTPTRECAHPSDAESRPNMAETRKREKPTPRPPEQRLGSPNRQEREPQRTAEDSNLTHNHVSEPISSRALHLAGLLSKKRETKQPSSTQDAQQEPAHHPPNVGHQRPTGGTNHRATRPNVGHNTRTRALVFNRFASPSTSRGSRTRTPNRAAHFECAMSTYSIRLASLSAHTSGASTSGGIDTPAASATRFLRTRLA